MTPSLVEATESADATAFVAKKPQADTQIHDASRPMHGIQSMGLAKDGSQHKIRTPPKFDDPKQEQLHRKQHLAAAFRVFADKGYDEGIAGHISLRDPINASQFWLNPLSMHFEMIRVSDLILIDEDGLVVEGNEPVNTAAFAIHSEIHKARPDVIAACHAHSVHGKAFSCFGRKLDMINQDALRFYNDHAVYDDFGGVVLGKQEGIQIAQALGSCKAVILQNHGLLTVGHSIDEAAFWFMSLDKCCHAQLLADAAAGAGHEKKIIEDEEAEFTFRNIGGPDNGWLGFQPYYDLQLKRTGGEFLN